MNILITGAFGNLGLYTIDELLKNNHKVFCFVRDNKKNRKIAKSYKHKAEIIWGDIRNKEELSNAVKDKEVIIHLAFVIPPASEKNKELSEDINVNGTKNLLDCIKEHNSSATLIFASSIIVFGQTQDLEPPRKHTDPLVATNSYSSHKILCEDLVKKSGIKYSILRIGAAMPISLNQIDPIMFEVPLNTRMEFVHPKDAGLAIANAAQTEKALGKILLIGGGKKCQLYYKDMLNRIMGIMGLDMIPEQAFTKEQFPTDWMDSEESQLLLQYQNRTYDDYVDEMSKLMGSKRIFAKMLKKPIMRWLLSKSPHYKEYKAQSKK